jgi:hypothetical protein
MLDRTKMAERGVPAALLEPGYWDTDPEDYVMNGEMPAFEWEHRTTNRRPQFKALLELLEERFDVEDDTSEWAVDEGWHSFWIPLSQLQAAYDLIDGTEFSYEEREDFDSPARLWVEDSVVAALLPEDYNPYTRRGVDPDGTWQAKGGDFFRSDPTLTPEQRWGWAPPKDGLQ